MSSTNGFSRSQSFSYATPPPDPSGLLSHMPHGLDQAPLLQNDHSLQSDMRIDSSQEPDSAGSRMYNHSPSRGNSRTTSQRNASTVNPSQHQEIIVQPVSRHHAASAAAAIDLTASHSASHLLNTGFISSSSTHSVPVRKGSHSNASPATHRTPHHPPVHVSTHPTGSPIASSPASPYPLSPGAARRYLTLHSPRSLFPQSPRDWGMLSITFRLGALLLLFFWVLWDCIVDSKMRPAQNSFWIDGVLPIYRACGFLLLSYWMWGVVVWIWKRYRINYLFLFELHPRTSDTPRQIFSNCISMSLVFLTNFLFYFKMSRGDFPDIGPSGLWPMGLFLIFLIIMIPWPYCGTPVKQWAQALGEVMLAPFRPVKFLHVFIGDILTSLVKPAIDFAYAICFVCSGLFLVKTLDNDNGRICIDSVFMTRIMTPLLSALPLWIRFLQCLRRYYDTRNRFPHMVNAGKYATAQSVVLIGIYHAQVKDSQVGERALWIMSLCFSTLYSYIWDVFMDWDLGKKEAKRLRPEMMYPSKTFYYTAIVLDLFFRFIWTITFIPASEDSPLGSWYLHSLGPVAAGCEIIRRTVWSLIRVENEFLAQVIGYQRTHQETTFQGQGDGSDGDNIEDHHEMTQLDEAEEQEETKVRGWVLLLEIGLLLAVVLAITLAIYFTQK